MLKRNIVIFMAAIGIACSLVTSQVSALQAIGQSPTRPIVYTNGLDGHAIRINPDGSDRHDYGPGAFPKLSPDGTKIAFSRDTADFTARDLYVANSNGSNLHKVADRVYTPGSPAYLFSWSPDSKKLVFTLESGAIDPTTGSIFKQIATVHASGSGLQQLTHDEAGVNNSNPVWSPDGKHILYQHDADIYLMNVNGSDERRVITGASQGSWSPDGERILFQETGTAIRTATINGTNQVTLSNIGNNATWSPDGKKIVMEAPNCGCASEPASIITFNPDGSGKTVVAAPPSAGAVQHPVWSPRSDTVAFVEFATWQPARLVTKPIAGGDASVVVIERVGYPEWAYTRAHSAPPRFPAPQDIRAALYQWLSSLSGKLRLF